jgi:hypothetical protein
MSSHFLVGLDSLLEVSPLHAQVVFSLAHPSRRLLESLGKVYLAGTLNTAPARQVDPATFHEAVSGHSLLEVSPLHAQVVFSLAHSPEVLAMPVVLAALWHRRGDSWSH